MHLPNYNFYAYFLALLALLSSAFVTQTIKPLTIRIKNGEVKVDKLLVSSNWYLPPLKRHLGTPEKIVKGVNNTYTYTDLGVVLFEGVDSMLNEFQVFYSLQNPTKVSPYSVYRGDLKIDKLVVDENLSKEQMFNSLIKWNPSPSFSPHLYRAEKEGVYLYFEFSGDEKSLVKVSIGRTRT